MRREAGPSFRCRVCSRRRGRRRAAFGRMCVPYVCDELTPRDRSVIADGRAPTSHRSGVKPCVNQPNKYTVALQGHMVLVVCTVPCLFDRSANTTK